MLVFDPNLRINASESLRHVYFNEYRQRFLYTGLNNLSSNNGQAPPTTNNFLLASEHQTTSTTFLQQMEYPSRGHVANSIDSRTSLSSLLTSSSSEDQLSNGVMSESDRATRSLPLTQ